MGEKDSNYRDRFLEQFFRNMISELDMGFQYHILHINNSKILGRFIKKSDRIYDGILDKRKFSGTYDSSLLSGRERPIGCFNTDDTAMYRATDSFCSRIESLIFRRVYADIMELFGVI